MAHTPLNMSIGEVQDEVRRAWTAAYNPAANSAAIDSIAGEPAPYKISHLAARLFFRGIYFPQKSVWGWLRLIASNRGAILRVIQDCFSQWHGEGAVELAPSLRKAGVIDS